MKNNLFLLQLLVFLSLFPTYMSHHLLGQCLEHVSAFLLPTHYIPTFFLQKHQFRSIELPKINDKIKLWSFQSKNIFIQKQDQLFQFQLPTKNICFL